MKSGKKRFSLRSIGLKTATVFALLKRPSLRSGWGPLGRRNCCRYAPTSLATLGEGPPATWELFSLRSNSPRFARDVFRRFALGHCSRSARTALATLGDLWKAGTVVATLQHPSLRSGRVNPGRKNCFRYAQTALASLGTFFDVLPRVTVVAPLQRPSLRSGTPRAFRASIWACWGIFTTFPSSPDQNFKNLKKSRFGRKTRFGQYLPYLRRKRKTLLRFYSFRGCRARWRGRIGPTATSDPP